MAEFLQSYGIWIFLGLLFSVMLWGHSRGHGMGGGGGGHQHDPDAARKEEQNESGKPGSGCH